MSDSRSVRMFTLARREMQECRNSLFWAPIGIGVGLVVIMLLSVLLANRVSLVGDTFLQVLLHEESANGMNINIKIDDIDGNRNSSYTIQKSDSATQNGDWDFSKDWEFAPKTGPELQVDIQEELDNRVENLNPVLNMVNNFFLLVLFMVSISYLLATLYNDRKDQSILFWRSMPVSEWEEVLSKFAIAMIVAPAIFIAISLLIQVAYILIAMLWVWRADMDPFGLVLGNIEFLPLLLNQIGGWLLTALWLAPIYAWLLLASAAAKRSPVFFAVAPVIALVLVEKIFVGTRFVSTAIGNHMPHFNDADDSLGFYTYGPEWATINYLEMSMGLIFTAVVLTAAVYLRRYRFEI
jgi:ABC-2 type transport system permease protein